MRAFARVFDRLVADPSPMSARRRRRIDQDGLERTICDYIAGMTDRFLIKTSDA